MKAIVRARPSLPRALAWAAITAGVVARVFSLVVRPLWADEIFTLTVARKSVRRFSRPFASTRGLLFTISSRTSSSRRSRPRASRTFSCAYCLSSRPSSTCRSSSSWRGGSGERRWASRPRRSIPSFRSRSRTRPRGVRMRSRRFSVSSPSSGRSRSGKGRAPSPPWAWRSRRAERSSPTTSRSFRSRPSRFSPWTRDPPRAAPSSSPGSPPPRSRQRGCPSPSRSLALPWPGRGRRGSRARSGIFRRTSPSALRPAGRPWGPSPWRERS